jgi:phospholipid/cholesterol/gamma-HCH transport system substrate-binding protein
MDRTYKLQHANVFAGAFVLIGLALLVAGILAASRVQGWFEGTFDLNAVFKSEEGSFGLQEGADVMIRNTLAGKVGKLVPSPDGNMSTVFKLNRQFAPLVREDSTAVVKRKFGVAGDAYVEITAGAAAAVRAGAIIPCVKDEDLLETAKRALADVQSAVVPVLRDVEGIVSNVNHITGEVAHGPGMVGTAIRDPGFADDIRTTVRSANGLLEEVNRTVRESRRLIEGFQRHWLVRRYVQSGDESAPLGMEVLWREAPEDTEAEARRALQEARRQNRSADIARHAFTLGLLALDQDRGEESERLARELRVESATSAGNRVLARLLEAETARRRRGSEEALPIAQQAVGLLDKTCSPELGATCHIRVGDLCVESGRTADAGAAIREARALLPKKASPLFESELRRLSGLVRLQEGRLSSAAEDFDAEAAIYSDNGMGRALAAALERAGDAYEADRQYLPSADRYYRAARGLAASENKSAAARVLAKAAPAARKADARDLVALVAGLGRDLGCTPDAP